MASVLTKSIQLTEHPTSLASSIPAKIAIVIGASAFVAVSAHISFPLPFTAVPLTLQTFAVILVGMLLGPTAGFSALALYLAEGAAGLPVFSPTGPGGIAQLLGPTAGYLFAYPLAAAIAGLFTRKLQLTRSSFRNGLIAGAIATLLILSLGTAWYAFEFHLVPATAWKMAIAPFLPGELVKIVAAADIFSSLRTWRQSPGRA